MTSLAPAPDVAVRTSKLRKVFGTLVAVEHLDLEILRGEVFGVLGPNGSGKTTTIRMLCGLMRPTSGDAMVVGCDIRTDSERLRTRIGYMSQRFGLYGDLTARENCDFYASLYGLGRDEREPRINELFKDLELTARGSDRAATLSGGLKQRLALACAIAHRPSLLFLDEPTAGVDPAARRQFWTIIYDLAANGTTIVVTTHYMDEAEKLKRLAFLSRGHLIAVGTPEMVTTQFGLPTIEDVFVELQRRDEAAA